MAHRLLGVLALALLLPLAACGGSTSVAPSAAPSSTTATSTAGAGQPYGAMTISRTGNGFTLTGEVPDEALRTGLPDSIRQAMPGAVIVDHLTVKPGVKPPEFGGLGALFGTAVETRGFNATLAGGTVTLTGQTDTAESRAAVEDSAKTTWPNVPVVNDIEVTSTSAAPPPAAAPAPPQQAAPAPPAAPAGTCATLQAAVTAMATTPITFGTNASALTPAAKTDVGRVADSAKACPTAKLVVTGYTDATGTDAINVPLSAARAQAVADALVSSGVPPAAVTPNGAGAAKPVGDNGTSAGRALNRRVEITSGRRCSATGQCAFD